jgi:hypothetical protein
MIENEARRRKANQDNLREQDGTVEVPLGDKLDVE